MKQNIYFLILVIAPNFLVGQYNTWTKKNDFIAGKRERAVAFAIGDYGYVSTGIDTAEILLKDLWQYDPNTDTWNQKADLPGAARRDAVAFSVNGKGYVGTGIDNASALVGNKLKDIWEYDPTLNSWIQKADFPGSGGNGIYFATAFSADNKGYVCGGKWGPNLYSSQLWEYKPSSDQWIQRANFPGGVRYQLSSFSIENQGYVGLGANQDIYKKDFYRYNPGSNQWTQIADFIGSERGGACSFTIKNRGFICLGTNGGLLGDLNEYNPELDEWEVRCAYGGSERKNAVAFVVNERVFVGLGKGYSGKKSSFQEYTAPNFAGLEEAQIFCQIYPNPSKGILRVSAEILIEQLQLFDTFGKSCFQQTQNKSNNLELDLTHLPSGVYYARILVSNGQFIQKQIIIE
jgi:N-acetylneuraminic acid mutarotase